MIFDRSGRAWSRSTDMGKRWCERRHADTGHGACHDSSGLNTILKGNVDDRSRRRSPRHRSPQRAKTARPGHARPASDGHPTGPGEPRERPTRLTGTHRRITGLRFAPSPFGHRSPYGCPEQAAGIAVGDEYASNVGSRVEVHRLCGFVRKFSRFHRVDRRLVVGSRNLAGRRPCAPEGCLRARRLPGGSADGGRRAARFLDC